MNRLVLIGNGFDLAHGLKTSYEDFLVDYIKGLIKSGKSDELTNIVINQKGYYDIYLQDIIDFSDIKSMLGSSYIEVNLGRSHPMRSYLVSRSRTTIQPTTSSNNKLVSISFKYSFLNEILTNKNWTDIESFYFKKLLEIVKTKEITEEVKSSQVKELNLGFQFLKLELAKYIKKLNSGDVNRVHKNHLYGILDGTFNKIKSASHRSKFGLNLLSDSIPERVFFINFNYTSVLKKYIGLLPSDKREFSTYLPIHGSVEDIESIIFGYGDETHEDYRFLENKDEEELLKNIKSFYYPAKSYYQELMDFINAEDFDVYVIGHSLGLSDRVLLKTIFENDKCKAIKLYHRGNEQSQFKKRIALSRHFEDKIAMRNKILNYSDEDVFGSI